MRVSAAASSSSKLRPSGGNRARPALIESETRTPGRGSKGYAATAAWSSRMRPRFVLRAAVQQHDHEFVAREPRTQIVLPHGRLQHAADGPQRAVSGFMPVGVVDLLEPIQIEHDHADGSIRAGGVREPGLELAIERPAVGQAGQWIGV
jgi:hypothetical protein